MVKQLSLLILFHSLFLIAELPEEAERKFKFAYEEKAPHSGGNGHAKQKFTPEFVKLLLAAAPKKFKEAIEKVKDPNCPDDLKVKRILLYGVPGNGKTTLAELAAHEMGVNFVLINSSLLGTEYVNSVAQNLMRKIEPHLNRPCVILLDEADSILREATGNNDPNQGIAQQVWQVLDELCKLPHVVIIGTTNNIKNMPAPMQSRFSNHIIEIPHADLQTKKEMIKFYLKGYLHECDDKFLSSFVEKCKDLSARDIENLVYGAKDSAYQKKPAPMLVAKKDLENSLADLLKNKKTMEKEKESKWQWTKRKGKEYGDFAAKTAGGPLAVWGVQWISCAKFGIACSVPPPSPT